MNLSLTPLQQHAILDFLAAVLAGAALAVVQYMADPEHIIINYQVLGASVVVGVILAARKWIQTQLADPAATKSPTPPAA